VTASYSGGGVSDMFQISVTNLSPTDGALSEMSFSVDAGGKIDYDTFQASYKDMSLLDFDDALLFDRIKDLSQE